jgi:hypothetical protein
MNRDEVLNWLLEEDNPPVRLLTLTRLLGRPDTDPEVQEARGQLMSYSVTQDILSNSETFWADDRPYWKYTGKYWQTIFLGQFLADGQDPRIAGGVHDLLADQGWVDRRGGQCLTANMLAAFRRLGYGDHPRVIKETEALAERLLADQGLDCGGMTYSLLTRCYMALPNLLLCFAGVPAAERSPAVQSAIEWIVREIVDREVYLYVPGNRKAWQKVLAQAPKKDDLEPGETVKDWIAGHKAGFLDEQGVGNLDPKSSWTQFGFPLNYNSDILEVMLALAAVDVPMSEALEKPLQVIIDKRTADEVWLLERTLNGKMWTDVEVQKQPSKWITLRALLVLDHFG